MQTDIASLKEARELGRKDAEQDHRAGRATLFGIVSGELAAGTWLSFDDREEVFLHSYVAGYNERLLELSASPEPRFRR